MGRVDEMKKLIFWVGIAVLFGTFLFLSWLLPDLLYQVLSGTYKGLWRWRDYAAFFIFCVAVGGVGIIDTDRNRKKTFMYRTSLGMFAGIVIATIYSAPGEGYMLGILLGGALGYFGRFWIKHL